MLLSKCRRRPSDVRSSAVRSYFACRTHSYSSSSAKVTHLFAFARSSTGFERSNPVLKSESSPMRQQSVTTPVALFRSHSLIELHSVHTLVSLLSPTEYYYGSAFFQACLSRQPPKSSASSPKISATNNSAAATKQQTSHHPISRRTRWNPIGPTELNK